jgi:hypothetical protein
MVGGGVDVGVQVLNDESFGYLPCRALTDAVEDILDQCEIAAERREIPKKPGDLASQGLLEPIGQRLAAFIHKRDIARWLGGHSLVNLTGQLSIRSRAKWSFTGFPLTYVKSKLICHSFLKNAVPGIDVYAPVLPPTLHGRPA